MRPLPKNLRDRNVDRIWRTLKSDTTVPRVYFTKAFASPIARSTIMITAIVNRIRSTEAAATSGSAWL